MSEKSGDKFITPKSFVAGSRISENDYYGIATEADMVGISSSCYNSELLEDVRAIAQYAQEQNQPCVINMSLGAVDGPGDGSSTYSKQLDEILKQYPNTTVVVSAGNSGDTNCHVTHTFKEAGEEVFLLVNDLKIDKYVKIWSDKADHQKHFEVLALVLNYLYDNKAFNVTGSTNSFQGDKQCVYCGYDSNDERHLLPNRRRALLVVISGLEKGVTFHAWAPSPYSFIEVPDVVVDDTKIPTTLAGANNPSICEVGEMPIMVGNYVTRNIYPHLAMPDIPADHSQESLIGYLNSNSSRGPSLNSKLRKPTITAPGTYLISSMNEQKPKQADEKDGVYEKYIVSNVVRDGKNNYYGAYSGTSMSAPVVSGCIALWKQAYPQLTTTQIEDIIKRTARKDDYTKYTISNAEENTFDSDGWSRHWGYGKFDAYGGLKEVLKLKQGAHIQTLTGSTEPVSLQKQQGEWRILFNNNEPQADIYIYDIQGRMVDKRHYSMLKSGQEVVLPLNAYDGGVYTIRIKTSKSDTARKLMR